MRKDDQGKNGQKKKNGETKAKRNKTDSQTGEVTKEDN